jgi:hypothetical protein
MMLFGDTGTGELQEQASPIRLAPIIQTLSLKPKTSGLMDIPARK